jgi:hypothetical protein
MTETTIPVFFSRYELLLGREAILLGVSEHPSEGPLPVVAANLGHVDPVWVLAKERVVKESLRHGLAVLVRRSVEGRDVATGLIRQVEVYQDGERVEVY